MRICYLDVIMWTKRTLISDDVPTKISQFAVQCHRSNNEHTLCTYNVQMQKQKHIFEITNSLHIVRMLVVCCLCGVEIVYGATKVRSIALNARHDFSLIHDIYWTYIFEMCVCVRV